MDNQNSPAYFYGTMRGDGYVGLDVEDVCPLTQYRDRIISTEFFPVIDENRDK